MATHMVFLDESGDHSMQHIDLQYPVFALAACIFKTRYYLNKANPLIDRIKYKYWGHRGVIFHSVDIRKQRSFFSNLRDSEVRSSFLNDISELIRGLDFKIIASGIHKADHNSQYAYPNSPYNLTLEFIMERLFFYFKDTQSRCILIAESRDQAENKALYRVFKRLMEFGNQNISSAEFKRHIIDLKFVPKHYNENGSQITDLVVYPIARKIISRAKGYQSYLEVREKFYSRSNGVFWGYGLKAFPESTFSRIKGEID